MSPPSELLLHLVVCCYSPPSDVVLVVLGLVSHVVVLVQFEAEHYEWKSPLCEKFSKWNDILEHVYFTREYADF